MLISIPSKAFCSSILKVRKECAYPVRVFSGKDVVMREAIVDTTLGLVYQRMHINETDQLTPIY